MDPQPPKLHPYAAPNCRCVWNPPPATEARGDAIWAILCVLGFPSLVLMGILVCAWINH